jgi:predicted amidohydrolase
MTPLKIATVQFENASGDKSYNLGRIEAFCERAEAAGAEVVAFHECSVTGYTFARSLSKEQLTDLAEPIPSGPSTQRLHHIAARLGISVVFSNPIGMDDDQLKNGCSMILDPFGDILAEAPRLEEGFALATLVPEKLTQAGGYRYKQARRSELYRAILGQEHTPQQNVVWMKKGEKG